MTERVLQRPTPTVLVVMAGGTRVSPELVERLAEWNDERKETAYSNVDFSSLDVEEAWVHRGRVPARG